MDETGLVESFFDGEIDQFIEAAQGAAASSAVGKSLRAVAACLLAMREAATLEVARAAVDDCFAHPCRHLPLQGLVVHHAVWLAIELREYDEAERLIGRLSQWEHTLGRAPWRPLRLLGMARLEVARADYAAVEKLLREALGDPGVGDGYLSRQLELMQVDCCLRQGDLPAVDRYLGELEAASHRFDSRQQLELVLLRVRRLTLSSEMDKALALISSIPPEQERLLPESVPYWRAILLAESGRCEAAEKMLTALERSTASTRVNRALVTIASFRGDAGAMRKHTEAVLAAHPSPTIDHISQRYLVEANFLTGRVEEARQGLLRIDPGADRRRYRFEWFRLHLLAGDERRAARCLRGILKNAQRGQLEYNLRTAHEISAYQMERMKRLAMEMEDDDEESGATSAEAAATVQLAGSRFVGRSRAAVEVRESTATYATLEAPVMLSGPTGTGKEVVARLLHDLGPRAGEQFLAVNCGGITDSLVESELFGHEKGAFTGATSKHAGLFVEAGRGTLFLDEINSMSTRLQASLLRVLEHAEVRAVGASHTRKIHCRIVAATNVPLEEEVRKGRFRADLYYRLSRLRIDLPPLSQRPDDVEPLVRHFLEAMDAGHFIVQPELLAEWRAYAWPGNVRELKNEVEYLALTASDPHVLTIGQFRKDGRVSPSPVADPVSASGRAPEPTLRIGNALSRRRFIRQLFEQHEELTRAEVIQMVGCSPNTATRDLRALTEEGFVQRVQTSSHVRTSYFRLTRAGARGEEGESGG